MASANIFQQYLQPVRSVADYTSDMDKADLQKAQLQNVLGVNALQALTRQQQAQQAQQAMAQQNAIQRVYAGGGKPTEIIERLKADPLTADRGFALEKEMLGNQKLGADTSESNAKAAAQNASAGKTTQEAQIKARQDAYLEAASLNTPEDAIAALSRAVTAGKVPMQAVPALQRMVQSDPLWKLKLMQGALDPDKLKEALMPHFVNGGDAWKNTNPTAVGAAPIPIAQSEDNAASNARQAADAAASRAQAERHFNTQQNAPQYMETDAGLVALPKKLSPGQVPTGTPVMGANGEALGKPLKPLPPAVNDAVIGNAQSLYTLDKAIALLNGTNVDSAKGDKEATGWKGYLPQAILNRVDPSGVDTRAEIADIGSLKIHDRSGAAVTISESPRLMPFIPSATDPPDVAARKLTRLKEEAQRNQQALSDTYSKEQGYKPSPVKPKTNFVGSNPPAAPGGWSYVGPVK